MSKLSRGFSLIELLITVAIFGVLLAMGASSFQNWLTNARIRTTAEAIQNGLQLARAEAVRRNTPILFSLTNGLGHNCALIAPDTPTVSSWVVSFDVLGACDAPPLNEALSALDAAQVAPRILQTRSFAESSERVFVSTNQPSTFFNGLGRLGSPPSPPVGLLIKVTGSAAAACPDVAGAPIHCLQVVVTPGGQIRMCDPAFATNGTDPQRCPPGG